MTDLELELHRLVHVRLQQLSTSQVAVVRKRLGHFRVEPTGGAPDVLCAPLPESAAMLRELTPRVAPQQVSTVWFEGRRVLLYSHRGHPDLILDPGTPVRLLVSRRAGAIKRFYNALLFAIHLSATRRGGLLLHAAALRDPHGRTALVLGPRRSRKTHLTLELLDRGWDYLADDKLLLHQGRAHLFEHRLVIRRHHLSALPWLAERLDGPDAPRTIRSQPLRRLLDRLQHVASRTISEKLQPLLQPLINPAFPQDLTRHLPSARILSSARPDALFVLAPGERQDCAPLAATRLLRQLVAIERLYLGGMGPLEAMSDYAHPDPDSADLTTLLERNLAGVPGFGLAVAEQASTAELADRLARRLADLEPETTTPCPA